MSLSRSGIVPAAVFCLFIASCYSVPKQETKTFKESVGQVAQASDPLFDQLSLAERRQQAIKDKLGGPAVLGSFDPKNAYYYSTIGDAPSTTKLRLAFKVIESYADLLESLVDGSSATEQQGQVKDLVGSIAALTKFTGATALLTQLSPILNQILTAANADEARRLVLHGEPAMIELLEQFKAASPSIFQTLVFEDRPGVSTKSVADRDADLAAQRSKVANFVVLIDRLEDSFRALAAVYRQPSNPVTLAAIAKASGDLQADVQSVRKAYASLNTKS